VLLGLLHLAGATRPAQAVGRVGVDEVRRVRDLGIAVLVVVGGGDVHDALGARPADERVHLRQPRLRAGHGEAAVLEHEVALRVDVPEDDAHRTSSSRSLASSARPTFATGTPSQRTTSAVKSFSPRMSAEPTPYASTGTPACSNARILAAVKPPEATIRTGPKPARASAARTL